MLVVDCPITSGGIPPIPTKHGTLVPLPLPSTAVRGPFGPAATRLTATPSVVSTLFGVVGGELTTLPRMSARLGIQEIMVPSPLGSKGLREISLGGTRLSISFGARHDDIAWDDVTLSWLSNVGVYVHACMIQEYKSWIFGI